MLTCPRFNRPQDRRSLHPLRNLLTNTRHRARPARPSAPRSPREINQRDLSVISSRRPLPTGSASLFHLVVSPLVPSAPFHSVDRQYPGPGRTPYSNSSGSSRTRPSHSLTGVRSSQFNTPSLSSVSFIFRRTAKSPVGLGRVLPPCSRRLLFWLMALLVPVSALQPRPQCPVEKVCRHHLLQLRSSPNPHPSTMMPCPVSAAPPRPALRARRRTPVPSNAASRQISVPRGGAVPGPGGPALIPGGKHPPPGRGSPPPDPSTAPPFRAAL